MSDEVSIRQAASLLLSEREKEQIMSVLAKGSEQQRIFVLGSLLMVLTASIIPGRLQFSSRLASFKDLVSEGESEKLAAAGFFNSAKDGISLCCFHCNAKCSSLEADPLQLHARLSPRCFLQRLLRLCSDSGAAADGAFAEDAAKFSRAMGRLRGILDSDLLRYVESYGFSSCHVQLAAARFFMTQNGAAPATPRQVMQLLHYSGIRPECQDTVASAVSHIILNWSSLSPSTQSQRNAAAETDAASTRAAGGSAQMQRSQAASSDGGGAGAETSAAEAAGKTLSRTKLAFSDGICSVCNDRACNRVLLPCSHFCCCDACLQQQLQRCPVCGDSFAGFHHVYVT